MLWRYRPADNRTPKLHPIIGHLVWDQVYDNPACADDPDFVPVDATPHATADSTSATGTDPSTADDPTGSSDADNAAEQDSADAGTPGRSKAS